MTPSLDIIMDACRNRSATEAARHLWAQGYAVTRSRCETMVSILLAAGERTRQTTAAQKEAVWEPEGGIDIRRTSAEDGCRALLRRQLETGAHWISCPNRLAMAMAEAGLS